MSTMEIVRSASETVREAFNFQVMPYRLSGPDNLRTPWYGLFRSDNGQPVGSGSVTSRYCPHTTEDVVALVEAAQAAFESDAVVRCHFRDGHYVSIRPTNEHRKAIFGTQDNVFLRLMIDASYDRSAFTASVGFYRDMCKNLAFMKSVGGTTVSIRHNLRLRSKMDYLINQFQTLRGSWDNLTVTIEKLSNIQINFEKFLEDVYGKPEQSTGKGATMYRKRIDSIFSRLSREATQLGLGLIGRDAEVPFVPKEGRPVYCRECYQKHRRY